MITRVLAAFGAAVLAWGIWTWAKVNAERRDAR